MIAIVSNPGAIFLISLLSAVDGPFKLLLQLATLHCWSPRPIDELGLGFVVMAGPACGRQIYSERQRQGSQGLLLNSMGCKS